MELILKLYCPKCGKVMSADTHDEKKNTDMDNWWCNDCEILIDIDLAKELL